MTIKEQDLAKLAYGLIDYFIARYMDKFNIQPQVNRFRNKYGFQDMIKDLNYDRSKEIIDYYFSCTRSKYAINDLLYSYDKLNEIYEQILEDEIKRNELRAETKKRVEEWDKKHES